MKTSTMKTSTTTNITRRPCYMLPDPCVEADYVATGVNAYGDPFTAVIHRRRPRCWQVENDDLRQTWHTFDGLAEAVAWLEGDF
jgi:hypothetical protein